MTDSIIHVYYNGLDGKPLADFYLSGSVQGGDPMVYFAGKRVDNVSVEDRLGTAVVEGATNAMTYFPYGELRNGTSTEVQFATYKRDSTTNFDYAHHRYYSSQIARFLTPDPYQANTGGPGDPAEPQSWNRYTYVDGDPVNFEDPEGLMKGPPACGGSWYRSGQFCVPSVRTEDFVFGDGHPHVNPNPPDGPRVPPHGVEVTDYSTTSLKAIGVQNSLRTIQQALQQDSKCGNWLSGNQALINTLVGNTPSGLVYAGVGDFSSSGTSVTNAIAGAPASTGLPAGALLTVNADGAFFSASATTGYQGDISGGSDLAKAFILLHELGHLTGAAGFQSNDSGSTKQAIANQDWTCP